MYLTTTPTCRPRRAESTTRPNLVAVDSGLRADRNHSRTWSDQHRDGQLPSGVKVCAFPRPMTRSDLPPGTGDEAALS